MLVNIQIVMEHLGKFEYEVRALSINEFTNILAYIKMSRKANGGLSNKEAALSSRLGL